MHLRNLTALFLFFSFDWLWNKQQIWNQEYAGTKGVLCSRRHWLLYQELPWAITTFHAPDYRQLWPWGDNAAETLQVFLMLLSLLLTGGELLPLRFMWDMVHPCSFKMGLSWIRRWGEICQVLSVSCRERDLWDLCMGSPWSGKKTVCCNT